MKKIIYKCIKGCIVLLLTFPLAFINDIYIRNYFYIYDRQLRCFDHFLAGITMTYLLGLVIDDMKQSMGVYVAACFILEIYQRLTLRNYFQFDQFACDFIGASMPVLILILKNSKIKNKNLDKSCI